MKTTMSYILETYYDLKATIIINLLLFIHYDND